MTKYQEEQELPKVAQFEMSIFIKMVFCSLIGIFSFFITFEWNGKTSILIDHIVSAFTTFTNVSKWVCVDSFSTWSILSICHEKVEYLKSKHGVINF